MLELKQKSKNLKRFMDFWNVDMFSLYEEIKHWGHSRLPRGTTGAGAAVYFDFLVLHVWNYTFYTDWSRRFLRDKILDILLNSLFLLPILHASIFNNDCIGNLLLDTSDDWKTVTCYKLSYNFQTYLTTSPCRSLALLFTRSTQFSRVGT